MGSKTFDGVRFSAYTDDHLPSLVHGFYAEVEVIVELLIAERKVRLALRDDSTRPRNAKRSDVMHVLRTATHFDIFFLSPEQEKEVARVAKSFYQPT